MAVAIFKENASKHNQVSKCFCKLVCITVLAIDLVSEDIIIFYHLKDINHPHTSFFHYVWLLQFNR